jgi:hypothetical protein
MGEGARVWAERVERSQVRRYGGSIAAFGAAI